MRHLEDLLFRPRLAGMEKDPQNAQKTELDPKLNRSYVSSLGDFFSAVNENIRNVFSIMMEQSLPPAGGCLVDIRSTLRMMGAGLWTSCGISGELTKADAFVSDSFASGFFEYINLALGTPEVPGNFAAEYVAGFPVSYQVELMKKYMRKLMLTYSSTAICQEKMLAEFGRDAASALKVSEEVAKMQAERYPKNGFFDQQPARTVNPDLAVLESYLAVVMSDVKVSVTINRTRRAQRPRSES